MSSYGKNETEKLKQNVEGQLDRLMEQLADLESCKFGSMEEASFASTWEVATTVLHTEEVEVSTMENEIIPSQSEEFIGEVSADHYTEDVVVEQVVLEETQSDAELLYLTVMQEEHTETYTDKELMEVTGEVITDQWDESCAEEIIVGSGETAIGGQPSGEEEIPLPTNQDEYTAARPYTCDFCSRKFRKKENLMNHMVAHQTDRPRSCNLCGMENMTKADLLNHLKNHAYIPEEVSMHDDQTMLLEQKGKTAGRKKKQNKPVIKEDYDSMFTATDEGIQYPSSTVQYIYHDEGGEVKYIEERENTEYHQQQEKAKYIITDAKKPFVCQHCGLGFAREKALASHEKIHGSDSPFECYKCGEMFWKIDLMENHVKTKHGRLEELDNYSKSDNTTFYCATCGLSFHRQDNLRRHQSIHVREKYINNQDYGHICSVCGGSFKEALDLLAHAEVHVRGSEYRCMICGEMCFDEGALAGHVQSAHKNLPPFTCILCGRTCKDRETLSKHSREHSKEKSLSCTKCSKTFANKARLKRHMVSHGNKVVSCDTCGEDFPDGRSLSNHRHSHSVSGRQFPCIYCGKTFGSRSSQRIHIRIHTGERPYGCRFCWKAFADGGTLNKHERIHTGERPYACAVCPRAFNQRVVLREHIRSHHSGPDPKYSHSVTPFCCSVCSDVFATKQDLILHLIHHCDMNTAMMKLPQVRAKKYKRRRKLEPHELDLITHNNEPQEYKQNKNETVKDEEEEEHVYQEPQEMDTKPKVRRSRRTSSRKGSSSSPKTSVSESISEIYDSLNTIENNDALVVPESPISQSIVVKKTKNENSPTFSRPKMIHTEKIRVPVETNENGRVRHKTKTLVTRTQPAEIKPSTGEGIRPRTNNVSDDSLKPERYLVATFPDGDQTEEAVANLLKQSSEDRANSKFSTEEIVVPDVAGEQTVETEVSVPTTAVESKTSRTLAGISSKNVIGRGSKVRLVKEPDLPPGSPAYIKQELQNTNYPEESQNHIIQTEEQVIEVPVHYEMPLHNAPDESNLKQEPPDQSALRELADISMSHANRTCFKCEMCDAVFPDRAQLLVHVRIHIFF